jgi:DNA replication protein DnaC
MSRAVDVKVELTQSLKYLHLPTVRQCYEEVAQQAERESLSYERYLHELVQRECEERQENRISKMLRESQLPLEKSLAAFDAKRLPAKAARQMRSLLDGSFLERTENVLVFGNPGSGKTTTACGLASLLPSPGPFVNLPIGATEDRLLGG